MFIASSEEEQNIINKFNNLCSYLINNFNINIQFSSGKNIDNFNCPFSGYLGSDYNNKIIFIHEGSIINSLKFQLIGGIIHEAGHIVACLEEPEGSEEYNFHGWEYLVALECNVLEEWLLSNNNYLCGPEYKCKELGALNEYEFAKYIASILILSTEKGLIKNGKPIGIR